VKRNVRSLVGEGHLGSLTDVKRTEAGGRRIGERLVRPGASGRGPVPFRQPSARRRGRGRQIRDGPAPWSSGGQAARRARGRPAAGRSAGRGRGRGNGRCAAVGVASDYCRSSAGHTRRRARRHSRSVKTVPVQWRRVPGVSRRWRRSRRADRGKRITVRLFADFPSTTKVVFF